jgi:hypothetical protein
MFINNVSGRRNDAALLRSSIRSYQFSFDLYAAEVIAVACLWWLFHFSGHQVRLEFRLPYRLLEVVAFHYEAESNFKQARTR